MAYQYYLATGNADFLDERLEFNGTATNKTTTLSATVWELLQKEFNFWEMNRSINVTAPNGLTYSALHYSVKSNTPRPESYTFDIQTASGLADGNKIK